MTTFSTSITVKSTSDIDIIDITDEVLSVVSESGISDGQACVFVGGSTGSVTTIEYEPGVVSDLVRILKEIAPPENKYAHDAAWHDGNGYSHVLAALLGPSRTFPIANKNIPLGTWQQIVLVDLDNKARLRKVKIHCLGE